MILRLCFTWEKHIITENAEYVTAREIFKELLQKYPSADFSKLVAIRLGDFLRDEGKEDEAIKAYKCNQ